MWAMQDGGENIFQEVLRKLEDVNSVGKREGTPVNVVQLCMFAKNQDTINGFVQLSLPNQD